MAQAADVVAHAREQQITDRHAHHIGRREHQGLRPAMVHGQVGHDIAGDGEQPVGRPGRMRAPQQQPDEDGIRGPERRQHARRRRVDAEDGTDDHDRADEQRVFQVEAGIDGWLG
jgi:hypothetical protein